MHHDIDTAKASMDVPSDHLLSRETVEPPVSVSRRPHDEVV